MEHIKGTGLSYAWQMVKSRILSKIKFRESAGTFNTTGELVIRLYDDKEAQRKYIVQNLSAEPTQIDFDFDFTNFRGLEHYVLIVNNTGDDVELAYRCTEKSSRTISHVISDGEPISIADGNAIEVCLMEINDNGSMTDTIVITKSLEFVVANSQSNNQ